MDSNHLTLLSAPFSLLIVAFLWNQPFAVLAGLVLTASFILYIRKSKTEFLFFTFAGVAGATAEIIAIYAGAWSYASTQFLRIPVWLPVLWGIAALFTEALRQEFENLREWYFNSFYRNYRHPQDWFINRAARIKEHDWT